MVQIKNCISQGCELSIKSDLRRSIDTIDNLDAATSAMGNQESQQHQDENKFQSYSVTSDDKDGKQHDFGEKLVKDLLDTGSNERLNVKRCYTPDQIMALKESPLARVKPDIIDDQPYWIGNENRAFKRVVNRPRSGTPTMDPVQRYGSGRLLPGSGEIPYRPFREKTGREFAENLIKRQGRESSPNELNLGYFNPVNQDHRRLVDEKSEDNEPEWLHNGPLSRIDTIDLHGFEENELLKLRHATSSPAKERFNTSGHSSNHSGHFSNRNSHSSNHNGHSSNHNGNSSFDGKEKYSAPFAFDEFNKPHFGQNNRYGSRFRNYFPRDNFSQGQNYTQQHHHFAQHNNKPKEDLDSNNNAAANILLNLLHGHATGNTNFKQGGGNTNPFHQSSYNNLSQMPSVEELEARIRHDQQLLNQFQMNKRLLAGKNVVDVLNVFNQAQNRQQSDHPNSKSPRPILKNAHVEQPPMARAFEIQRQMQGNNPNLNPYNPQYWEMIHQRQQAYYQQYQTQNPTSNQQQNPNPHHQSQRPKFQRRSNNNNYRHVHFEGAPIDNRRTEQNLAQLLNNPQNVNHQTQIDFEKILKVEEFERKIKAVANEDKVE